MLAGKGIPRKIHPDRLRKGILHFAGKERPKHKGKGPML